MHSERTINDIRAEQRAEVAIKNPSMPAEQASPMQLALFTLTDEIDRAYSKLDQHVMKIEGIMGPQYPTDSVDNKTPLDDSSELVRAVIEQARRVRDLRAHLEYVTGRVEL